MDNDMVKEILLKIINDDTGYFDIELGIIDVRVDFTKEQMEYLEQIRKEDFRKSM